MAQAEIGFLSVCIILQQTLTLSAFRHGQVDAEHRIGCMYRYVAPFFRLAYVLVEMCARRAISPIGMGLCVSGCGYDWRKCSRNVPRRGLRHSTHLLFSILAIMGNPFMLLQTIECVTALWLRKLKKQPFCFPYMENICLQDSRPKLTFAPVLYELNMFLL